MLFSNYHENDAKAHSFTSKLSGLAKLTGVVAAGLVASRPLLRLAGRAGIGITRILGQENESFLSKIVGGKIGGLSVDSAIQTLASHETRVISDIADQVEKGGFTFASNKMRIESFLDKARYHVKEESKAAFDKNKEHLVNLVSEVGRASHGHETESTFLKTGLLNRFNAKAKKLGVEFGFDDMRQQQTIFRQLIDDSVDASASRQALNELMSDPKNRQSVLNFAREGARHHATRSKAIPKIFGFGDRVKPITWHDIRTNKEVEEQVNSFLGKLTTGPASEAPTVEGMLGRIEKKARSLFEHVHEGEKKGAESVDELMDILHKHQSGFALTQDAKGNNTGVISLAQFRNVKDKFVDRALEEVQIPLVPYSFGVPLKTFRGLIKPTKELAQNLGYVSNQTELRRLLSTTQLNQHGEHTQLVGAGDRVLAINPTSKSIDMIDGRFTTFRRADNSHWNRLADLRSQDPENWVESLKEFRGTESRSRTGNFLSSKMRSFSDLDYSPDNGWVLQPKDGKSGYSTLIKGMFGKGVGLDIDDIHPVMVSEFLDTHAADLNKAAPRDINNAYNTVIDEAGKQTRRNLSDVLSNAANLIEQQSDNDFADIPEEYHGVLLKLLRNSDNAPGTEEWLNNTIGKQTEPILEMTSLLGHKSSNPFQRAMYSLRSVSRRAELYIHGEAEGDVWTQIRNKVLGRSEIGATTQRYQEGLLSEVVHGMGYSKISKFSTTDIKDEVKRMATYLMDDAANHGDLSQFTETGIYKAAKQIGYTNDTDISSLIGKLSNVVKDEFGASEAHAIHSKVAELGTLLLTKDDIFKLSDNNVVHAKIMSSLNANLENISELGVTKKNQILYQMSQDFKLTETLKQRFVTGKAWHPNDQSINPFNTSRFMALPNSFNIGVDGEMATSMPSIFELTNMTGEQRIGYIKGQISRGFGVPDFVAGMIDPNKPLGTVGAVAQMLMQMPNNIGAEIGLGLSAQDRMTILRSASATTLKRVLPTYMAYEAYKNLNANLHAFGMNGLDDLAANILGNVNVTGASVKDQLGITKLNQNIVNTLPGLDQYFSPRSEDEYRDYLFYGDEGVRNGRGWLIGSRSNLTGGAIDNYRPNFYRRWKSHWTEADNVDIANPYYSWMPNLQNPISPLFRLTNPNWWINKHLKDRPYRAGGSKKLVDPYDQTGFVANSESAYGSLGIGTFGGGLGPRITGGGEGEGGGGGNGSWGGGASAQPGQTTFQQGDPLSVHLHKVPQRNQIGGHTVYNSVAQFFDEARSQAGIFGLALSQIPFYPHPIEAFQPQDSKQATALGRLMWMGNYGEATGILGEYLRRFIPEERVDLDAWNPLPNNMPSWVPDHLKTGDPYMRVKGIGELSLPGDAYERTHPWVTPLKVRGSAIGGSEEEIIESWLHPMKELDGPDAEDIVEFGSAMHKDIQTRWKKNGTLISAETSIYDKLHNISGTIDAIVRGETGAEIVDIKTQGAKSWGHTPGKYIDQINTYMAITGIKRAHLYFINRDDTTQTRTETFDFDPQRWQQSIERVDHARQQVKGMIDNGIISPFETYDLLARIEILSKIAPDGAEFKRAVKFAEGKGGFGGFEKQRFEQAIMQAKELRKSFNTYPYRYRSKTETKRLRVEGVTPNGDIVTEMGIVKLAGVKWDHQAFAFEDADHVLGRFGIYKGTTIPVTLIKGQFNSEVMADTPLEAIVGHVNKDVIRSQYANADVKRNTPLSSKVVHGNSIVGKVWERLVHTDNMITNKFMRVRSPLEQFERGEVYGTDRAKLSEVWSTIAVPTLNSLAHNDPISATIKGALVGGALFTSKNMRMKGAAAFAVGAFALSSMRSVFEATTGRTWTPTRYREQSEFDEYWDMLSYVKNSAVAEGAKNSAKVREHTDIDQLENGGERRSVGLGPWGVLAVEAERKARRTMYGFDVATGSLQDALAAIPARHKQIAEEIVMYGSMKEKEKFYNYLGGSEQRVLGKFLGVNSEKLPDRPNVDEFFKTHFLPDANWEGWGAKVDMNDLRTRSAALEKVKIERPSRQRVAKSRAYSTEVSIPRMDHPTVGNIKRHVHDILKRGGLNGLSVDFVMKPSDHHVVNIDADIFHDASDEVLAQMRDELKG